jgi:DNA replication protein DnaC
MTLETCSICGGTGWQTIVKGKERAATPCECRVKGRPQRLLEAARIPARYEHCEFSSFEYDPDDRGQKKIVEARTLAGRFAEEYPVEKTGLLFTGSVGVGKTHLAVAIMKALMREKGIRCLFCDYRELLKSIQNSYNPSVQTTETEILRPVFEAEVLVLDELGAARSTEWVSDTVNYILNSRYSNNKTTIITTNFSDKGEQEKLDHSNSLSQSSAISAARRETLGDRIGQRMWSRLHEMCRKVEIEGPDYREHSKQARFQRISAPNRLSLRNSKEGTRD